MCVYVCVMCVYVCVCVCEREREKSTTKKEKVLISPMFYEQFLRAQTPKVQLDTDDLTVFLFFLGSA